MPGLNREFESSIPVSFLRECFWLDEEGRLHWLKRPRRHFKSSRGWNNFNTQFAGKPAGTLRPDGYYAVNFLGRPILSHRIIWALRKGEWPGDELDHVNRKRSDNAEVNLRIAGPKRNSWNHGVSRNNTSGFTGVVWAAHCDLWRARIRHNGQAQHLGYFRTPEAAHRAYRAASLRLRASFVRQEYLS